MRKDQQLGLDELMIVNPSSSEAKAMFLGEEGILYQVQGLGEETKKQEMGQYFLSEDGSLYQVEGFQEGGSDKPTRNADQQLGKEDDPALGRYFLGADGALYEVVR
jgi:hypothetical protein